MFINNELIDVLAQSKVIVSVFESKAESKLKMLSWNPST